MPDFLTGNTDYLTLVAVAAVSSWLLQRWLAHRGVFHGLAAIWLSLAVLLTAGWFAVNAAGKRERERIKQLLEGFPPTYAVELERLGHASITAETKADDAVYLDLIAAQLRWLRANPFINDIYTIAKRPDGGFALLVDSETDYDQNGRIEGDTEARTAIGEPYDSPDPSLLAAFAGESSFSEQPYSDRWGQWVSAYHPLRDGSGRVVAVVGVDFSARQWLAAIRNARLGAIGLVVVATLLVLCLAAALAIIRLQRESADQRKFAAVEKAARDRFETLVNSIDGIVYEFNLQTGLFDFVSSQAEAILGYPVDHWLNKRDFWAAHLAPDEREKVIEARRKFLTTGAPFEVDYRLIHADGRSVWIHERSQAVDVDDSPALVRGVLFDVSKERR